MRSLRLENKGRDTHSTFDAAVWRLEHGYRDDAQLKVTLHIVHAYDTHTHPQFAMHTHAHAKADADQSSFVHTPC